MEITCTDGKALEIRKDHETGTAEETVEQVNILEICHREVIRNEYKAR